MNHRRPALTSTVRRRLAWLLVAAVALGGQVGLGSRAADRLASLLVDDPGAPLARLCGAPGPGGRLSDATPDGPAAWQPAWVPAAPGDAFDLLMPVPPADARSRPMPLRAPGRRLAILDVRQADGTVAYPRGPPDRV